MPNHVQNVLSFSGNEQEIHKLIQTVKSVYDDGSTCHIDFDNIIPMPKDLKIECISGIGVPQELRDKYKANLTKYGYTTGYEWSCDKWGTKWNAYETKIKGTDIYFQTAWSTPMKVIVQLSKMFPTLTIRLQYADEDIGNNLGDIELLNGEIVSEQDFQDVNKEEFACKLHEEDYVEYCKRCEEWNSD